VVKGYRHWFSAARYQRRHGTEGNAETEEDLGSHRRKLGEEAQLITVSEEWLGWNQGGGSGCSTFEPHAAKHARREGPGPAGIPFGKGGRGEMIKEPVDLQELRRRIYGKRSRIKSTVSGKFLSTWRRRKSSQRRTSRPSGTVVPLG